MTELTAERRTHGYCPECRESSAIDAAGNCLWCGGPTEPERPRRARRGGWKRPDIAGSRYTEAQLRALHVFHLRVERVLGADGTTSFEELYPTESEVGGSK